MNKLTAYLAIIFMTICLASIYGVVHDQITYTISVEYYTKFKFVQLNFDEVLGARNIAIPPSKEFLMTSPRIGVSLVGFISTWWVGLIIGIILGLVTMKYPNGKDMYKAAFRSALLCIGITSVFSVLGFLVGKSYGGIATPQSWHYPNNLLMVGDFVTAGMMHNFSYIGGGLALLFAVFRLIRKPVAAV